MLHDHRLLPIYLNENYDVKALPNVEEGRGAL